MLSYEGKNMACMSGLAQRFTPSLTPITQPLALQCFRSIFRPRMLSLARL